MFLDHDQLGSLSERIAPFATGDDDIATPFQYLDLDAHLRNGLGSGSALAVAPGGGDTTYDKRDLRAA